MRINGLETQFVNEWGKQSPQSRLRPDLHVLDEDNTALLCPVCSTLEGIPQTQVGFSCVRESRFVNELGIALW